NRLPQPLRRRDLPIVANSPPTRRGYQNIEVASRCRQPDKRQVQVQDVKQWRKRWLDLSTLMRLRSAPRGGLNFRTTTYDWNNSQDQSDVQVGCSVLGLGFSQGYRTPSRTPRNLEGPQNPEVSSLISYERTHRCLYTNKVGGKKCRALLPSLASSPQRK